MKSGEDTLLKDKDGKAILVHSHVADAKGDIFYINAFCQAVPKGEGVAVALADLVREGEVRVLSAAEVLELQEAKRTAALKPESKPAKLRRKAVKADGAEPATTSPEAPPAVAKGPESEDISDAEMKAELRLIIGTIPDHMLADELRRRGYVFSAVKPVIVNI